MCMLVILKTLTLYVHAGYFGVSIIHRTLKWTAGSLKFVCYLFACVYGQETPVNALTRRHLYSLHRTFFHVALRPRRRDDLLGTGTEWEGERVISSTAETARKRPERP